MYTNEESQWDAASNWVSEQVLITFRHRAIASRLADAPHPISTGATDSMLQIILPTELTSTGNVANETTHNTREESDSIAELKAQVRAQLKHMADMESLEEQVHLLKQRRKTRWIPRSKKSSSTINSSANRLSFLTNSGCSLSQ